MWDGDNNLSNNAIKSEELMKFKENFCTSREIFIVLELADRNEPAIKF